MSSRLLLPALVFAAACATPSSTPPVGVPTVPTAGAPTPNAEYGLLVMAHGGSPEWNEAVGDAVAPLRGRLPTALAFGMAEPTALQASLDSLRVRGVRRVAVVRLFMSGSSFLHRTEYLLGLRSDPPAEPLLHTSGGAMDEGGHGEGHHGPLQPVTHGMEILLSSHGLGESPLAGDILVDRARLLSRDASGERVILVAHGMGDEEENDEVLSHMRRPAEALKALGFSDVHVATLREDWPDARKQAEAEIRNWVAEGSPRGDRTLVVPFRLSGFGPYAAVLEDLEYVPADGLLPHPLVTTWIEEQAANLLCAGAGAGGAACRERVLGVEPGPSDRVPYP